MEHLFKIDFPSLNYDCYDFYLHQYKCATVTNQIEEKSM